ncbi:hypothetical protein QJQ45_007515 [Haematococcus lacustris]|nr:hypothetical protein QJQ45_007515 [Haematococcus lacustris]
MAYALLWARFSTPRSPQPGAAAACSHNYVNLRLAEIKPGRLHKVTQGSLSDLATMTNYFLVTLSLVTEIFLPTATGTCMRRKAQHTRSNWMDSALWRTAPWPSWTTRATRSSWATLRHASEQVVDGDARRVGQGWVLREGLCGFGLRRHFGDGDVGLDLAQAQAPQAQPRGRVVLVDEHRTSRVSSAVNGQQPCERQLNKHRATRPSDWKPPAGQVHHRLLRPAGSQQRDLPVRGMMWCPVVAPRKPPQPPRSSQAATQAASSEPGPSTPLPAKRSKRTKAEPAAEPTKGKGKAAKAKPATQPGRWLDRDCNAALNMQRIGESRWRPLELCWWPDQGALPDKGKEYPGLGFKRLRDKPPKAQQQQQQPAEAQ